MLHLLTKKRSLVLAILSCLLINGCGYSIKYNLSETTATRSEKPAPLKVAAVLFDDARDDIEREKDARKDKNEKDTGDYTYDKNFRGDVAQGITGMVVDHLRYSQCFDSIILLDYTSSAVNAILLDSLANAGVDALLTGEIEHFYGFYDRKPGKEVLLAGGLALAFALPTAFATTKTETKAYGFKEVKTNMLAVDFAASIGAMLGTYLESTGKRRISWRTMLSLQLVSTSTGKTIWKGTVDVNQDEDNKSMPGINTNTRKQQVAVESLREAVNQLVRKLAQELP